MVLLRFHKEEPGRAVRLVLYKGQPLRLQPVGPQHRQHLGQSFRPVAQRKAPAVLQKAERTLAHIVQCAGVLVPGKGVGCVLALGPIREIGRIARTHVKTALALPESAQVGTDRLNVPDVLLLHRSGKQSAALGLQLQPHAGAAVAAVVPFQRHDAAAGAQVCGLLGALWLTETGQQQRVGAKTMLRRAINHSSIIQDFGRMFHR